MNRRKSLLLLLPLLVCLAFPHAAGAFSPPEDLSGHHVLSNGLDVRLMPDPATPLVAALVLVKTGYATENTSNSGYTHLLEHLVFAGTDGRSKEQITREIEDLGGYLNGFTRDDYAGYLVVGHRDHLSSLLEILSDMLFHSILEEESIAEAREVVLEEIRQQRSRPGLRGSEVFQSLLYRGSSYARTGLGNLKTVAEVSRNALATYYRRTYRPDNMILLMAGGLSPDETLEIIDRTFGDEDTGGEEIPVLPAPPLAGQRVYTVKSDAPGVRVMVGFTGPDPRSGDAESLELLGAVLGGSGGILDRALEDAGLRPRSVSAYLAINRGFSRFVCSAAFPDNSDPNGALQVMLRAIKGAAEAGLPPARINETREALVSGEIMGREKLHYHLMEKAQWAVSGAPGQGFSPGRWDHLSAQDIDRVALRYLVDTPFAALFVMPGTENGRWDGGGGAISRAKSTLDNGLTVIAEQRPGSEVFALHLMTRRRGSMEPEGMSGIADFLHRMLTMGTFDRTKDDIEAELRALGVSLSTAGNPTVPFGDFYTSLTYSYIRAECVRDRAKKMVELLADLVRNPSFPEERMEETRSMVRDYIAYRDTSPGKAASAALSDRLYRGVLPADVLGTVESINAITREDLSTFHGRYLSGRNIILSVVSGLEPQQSIELMESYFSQLPPGEGLGDPELTETADSEVITLTLGKAQGALTAGMVGPEVEPGDLPALAIASGLLNDRLSRELREREGLAYSVGGFIGGAYGRSVFRLSMGTAQDKIDSARQSVRREIEALKGAEVTREDLDRRINALTGRLQMRMMSSINRAFYLALAEKEGLSHTFGEDYRTRLLALEPDEVERAIRRYLPGKNLVEVVVR
ncbi:MAG: insulinase family protein [bacterium]|nr:MAG: insulinase family protein [bacterium]